MDMTIEEFCDKHSACADGRNWALSCGSTTMHALWLREDLRHEWRMWIMQRDGVMTRTECVRFSCWSVRQIWQLLTDERSRKAIEVTEAFLEGKATIKEVEEAVKASAAAAADAASAAADAAYAAAKAADAASKAAADAAYAASKAADAAAYAAAKAADAAADAAQDKWLIENTKPNFAI